MQTIASTYIRTSQGRVTAFSTVTTLSPQFKMLLQAVDGKTSSSMLASQFSSMGNVVQWLGQLEAAGLIEDRGALGRTAAFEQNSDDIWGHSRAPALRPALHVVTAARAPSANALSLQPPAWQPTAAAGLEGDVPPRSMENLLAELTQQIADEMATFVLTYLPTQAYLLLRELETLRTPAQLKATLPSYEAMVGSAGQAGRQHMADLQHRIARQFIAS